jgi:hypothetical protein
MGKEIRNDLLEAFKNGGGVEFSNRGALKLLQNMLNDEETVLSAISGQNSRRAVVVALTGNRIIYAFNLLGIHETHDIPLSRITSITAGRDLMFGKIVVDSAGDLTAFDHVNFKHAEEFANIARTTMRGNSETKPSTQTDSASQLLQLKQLLDAGVLTPEEYEAKAAPLKARL